MTNRREVVGALLGTVLAGVARAAEEKGEKKAKPEQRSGTVVGVITGKGETYIEVKADGEEKPRRYMPRWVGGAPAQGGGLEKKMLATFRELKVGSRIRMEWEFEERPRAVKIEVIKAAGGKDEKPQGGKSEGEPKTGKAAGTLTAKGDNWIELKADGEEKPRRYFLHMGGTRELLAAIRETPVGSRVQIEWLFLERLRVTRLDPVKTRAE